VRTSGVIDWLFRSRTDGRIVLGQAPNLRSLGWLLAWLLSRAAPAGRLRHGLRLLSAAILTAWAVDEVARGVNPLRKMIGAGTLLVLAAGALRTLRSRSPQP
jgi:hypothetical protein